MLEYIIRISLKLNNASNTPFWLKAGSYLTINMHRDSWDILFETDLPVPNNKVIIPQENFAFYLQAGFIEEAPIAIG